jgi:hypothetical protein
MAWNVDQIYSFAKFLIRKNQAGGLKRNDLFYSWNAEQKSYQSDLLGKWQSRSNGKTGLNTGLIEDETIMQKLAPFIKLYILNIASGTVTKPSDFAYRLAMRINNFDVFKINHNQIASVSNSVIDPPSVSTNTYYFVEYQLKYSYLPNTVSIALLDYVSVPVDIVWGFGYDTDGSEIYNSGTSTQPQWDDLSIIEITKRSLKNLGVSFKDADFSNFGNSNIVTGD